MNSRVSFDASLLLLFLVIQPTLVHYLNPELDFITSLCLYHGMVSLLVSPDSLINGTLLAASQLSSWLTDYCKTTMSTRGEMVIESSGVSKGTDNKRRDGDQVKWS